MAASSRRNPEGLDAACREWAAALGADAVVVDPDELAHRGRTTLPVAPLPVAALIPSERAQVPGIVRTAARHDVALYPISCGRNWGWGDACPPGPGQVVLDLSRLTSLELDEALGVAVVEPGVTQLQLAEGLAATGWTADCTTAGPSASVLGNAVERGIGQTALGERWAHVWGVEAVLADGAVVRTNGGSRAGRRGELVGPLRATAGPVLDGLFAQSNLGVVTRLAVTLQPRPEAVEAVLGVLPDGALEQQWDRLRMVRLRGAPLGSPHCFPLGGQGAVREWLVVGALAGTRAAVAAGGVELDEQLGSLGRLARYPPPAADDPHAVLSAVGLPDEPLFREFVEAGAAYAQGWPLQLSPQFVLNYVGGAAAQRVPAPPTVVDPLDAGYGFRFAWPVSPSTGADVRDLVSTVEAVLARHGRPLALTLSSPNARSVVAVTRVPFAKDDPDDAAAAERCYAELLEACAAAGYPQARASISTMRTLAAPGAAEWDVVRRIKEALDPHAIIAPGRYEPWR